MWPFTKEIKAITKGIDYGVYETLEPTERTKQMFDDSATNSELVTTNNSAQGQLERAVHAIQPSEPLPILNEYNNWTITTIDSIDQSREVLQDRIDRDTEELRQLDKVKEGILCMKNVIDEKETIKPTSKKSRHPIENAQ